MAHFCLLQILRLDWLWLIVAYDNAWNLRYEPNEITITNGTAWPSDDQFQLQP